ncbi:MAG: type II toxin-antitoxin system ParD family antitoxin [Candidatus Omnitrophica bacterium]|nr:type II toxin-antitoxin system ParD family antitoxin [Candidatus Omnitrophota bacterium]
MTSRQSTQSINLTPEQSKFVDECIASGRFKSADEVFKEGLRLLEAEGLVYQSELEKVRSRLIQEGTEDLEAGRVVDGREVIARIKEGHQELERKTVES